MITNNDVWLPIISIAFLNEYKLRKRNKSQYYISPELRSIFKTTENVEQSILVFIFIGSCFLHNTNRWSGYRWYSVVGASGQFSNGDFIMNFLSNVFPCLEFVVILFAKFWFYDKSFIMDPYWTKEIEFNQLNLKCSRIKRIPTYSLDGKLFRNKICVSSLFCQPENNESLDVNTILSKFGVKPKKCSPNGYCVSSNYVWFVDFLLCFYCAEIHLNILCSAFGTQNAVQIFV